MRDIFTEIFKNEPLDPMVSARQGGKPKSLKRFYKTASAGETPPYAVLLDGKPVMTPRKRGLAAPVKDIAQDIVKEWNAQGGAVVPAAMPLTRLANAIVDGVADAPREVAAEIENYLGTDLLCYRAEGPPGLVALQAQQWDPILAFARDELGAHFVLAQGVVHTPQPPEAIAAAAKAIPDDPWQLGALSLVTTLTGSALIALALAHGHITAEQAWAAAHADEDWQMSQWGRDEMALARRAQRFAEMQAAARVLAALRG